jgi:hypothetical protein
MFDQSRRWKILGRSARGCGASSHRRPSALKFSTIETSTHGTAKAYAAVNIHAPWGEYSRSADSIWVYMLVSDTNQ